MTSPHWDSPVVVAAIKRGEAGLREVERVTVFINQLPDSFERGLSWKYYLACRFAGVAFAYTSDGIRPFTT
jgi:hypothetical protein